jgi:peptidoglycan/xylan/chitin deacetylase (PgdA/CDA1 family)
MQMPHGFAWPDQYQGAVTLTYDDGLPIHYTLVDPLLRQHNLRATFYPMIQSDLRLHPDRWRQLAKAGHELGNHTVFHPCRQREPDPYPWLDERYNLNHYMPAQLRAELEVANLVLHLLDGQSERTFGNTCCDTSIGSGEREQSLEPLLKDLFVAARGRLTNRIAQPGPGFNLHDIGCISADGRSFEELVDLATQARTSAGWAVLMMHGVGAETYDLHLEAGVHKRFVAWLAQQPTIWTAPLRTIGRYIAGASWSRS